MCLHSKGMGLHNERDSLSSFYQHNVTKLYSHVVRNKQQKKGLECLIVHLHERQTAIPINEMHMSWSTNLKSQFLMSSLAVSSIDEVCVSYIPHLQCNLEHPCNFTVVYKLGCAQQTTMGFGLLRPSTTSLYRSGPHTSQQQDRLFQRHPKWIQGIRLFLASFSPSQGKGHWPFFG